MSDYLDALQRAEVTINQLNVFPVPDGDTGTNMRSTVESVVAALRVLRGDDRALTADTFTEEVARASLLGARGNSGIILAEYLRVLVEALSRPPGIDSALFADAIAEAGVAARGAVGAPSEGTILSVADAAARGASNALHRGGDLGTCARAVYLDARDALWATPTQLIVLERAGVVDAGGAGLVLLFGCLANLFTEQHSQVDLELPEGVQATLRSTRAPSPAVLHVHANDLIANYEVLLLLESDRESIVSLKREWSRIGDSIAIVGSTPTFRCHIHTTDTAAALQVASALGRVFDIEVNNLDRQVAEQAWVADAIGGDLLVRDQEVIGRDRPSTTAVVAVVDGEGMERVYRSLGVGVVLQGGPAMNLSTKEFLAGIARAKAREIILFPNNADEFAIAHQVASLHRAKVEVVEATDVAAAASAIVYFDPTCGAIDNAARMRLALSEVRTGEVIRAIRDAMTDAGAVHGGDLLAISGSRILAIGEDLVATTMQLLDRLVEERHELLTIYRGLTLGIDDLALVVEAIGECHPGLVIEQIDGGQRHAELLVALE